jgi:alkylated DNA nucleotide flippase Atl1
VPVGQIVGQMNDVRSVAEVMRELVEGCRAAFSRVVHSLPPNLRGS